MTMSGVCIYATEHMAVEKIEEGLAFLLRELMSGFSELCILCIGSDRATGDSLGPIVGRKLREILPPNVSKVYGDLKAPVHAANILTALEQIYTENFNPLIIAVDAALSKLPCHVGRLNIGPGPLKPGTSVGKDLPAVGHIYITGIVNWTPKSEALSALQSTRLGSVFDMAEIIAIGIARAVTGMDI